MGIKERKKRDVRKMQKRVLDAAMELFAKGGYENVSMRHIARKIEYSPGTIYRYFRNKNDIMLQLCYQGFERFLAKQIELEKVADPRERLSSASRYYITFALENPELYELMLATKELVRQPDQAEESVALKSFRKLVETVHDCVDTGAFSGDDVEAMAIAIWSALHGLASLLIKERLRFIPPERLDGVIQKALEFNLRGGGEE